MTNLRRHWYLIIFESDTPAGKLFDVLLLISILLSLLVVSLETVPELRSAYQMELRAAEWAFTALFTLEYLARLWTSPHPRRYAKSFYGVVDLLSILPTYLSLVLVGSQYFLILRSLRLLRVFRVLKLTHFVSEGQVLSNALWASRHKILVFLLVVFTAVMLSGTLMYWIEGESNGFKSIPTSMYWAIVTLTTVGYGDISPQTPLGQFIASCIMVLGYGIIAVPTGIVTAELAKPTQAPACKNCGRTGIPSGAAYCPHCGTAQ